MNIGDRVRVQLDFKVNQMEQHIVSGEIIVGGFVDGSNIFVRVPQSACSVIGDGVETVLREIYAK